MADRRASRGFTPARPCAEHGFESSRRFAEHGFTLIEIMVALAVFSIAVLALIRLESATIRGASTIDETLTAQMVARNVAILAVTDARAPVAGISAGTEDDGGRRWRWTRQVQPTGDPRILRIEVAVAGSRGVLGRATMIRPPVYETAR